MALRFGYVDAPLVAVSESDYPLATLPMPVWASANDAYVRAGMGQGSADPSATAAPFLLSNNHGIAVLGHAEEYSEGSPTLTAVEGRRQDAELAVAG